MFSVRIRTQKSARGWLNQGRHGRSIGCMPTTALVYSSHSRSHHLHHDLIVQRALAGNRRLLLLPMSMGVHNGDELALQKKEVGSFDWYFRGFQNKGLEFMPFYWNSGLRQQDVDLLFKALQDSEVVLLAGGASMVGLKRYRDLGAQFFGDPDHFRKLLLQRQERGMLTVGFSAGADQLMDLLFRATHHVPGDNRGFGLISETLITLHHDPSRNQALVEAARQYPGSRVFGLPNDSGLAVSRGVTPKGAAWQLTRFVVDSSWDRPEDAWHVRTRGGAAIEHFYSDGRHWTFREGDWMLRVKGPDGAVDESWVSSGGRLLGYQSQAVLEALAPEQILSGY